MCVFFKNKKNKQDLCNILTYQELKPVNAFVSAAATAEEPLRKQGQGSKIAKFSEKSHI